MDITIRRLTSLDEYAEAEALLQVCWQTGPLDAIPAHLMITIQHEAGLVLGAFTPEAQLIGFVLGFLSRDEHGLKHHSHMTGVHPAFRDRNIAYRLKLAQREAVLAQGLSACTWTYDPLECRNAVLNIAKLGATARVYRRNVYGQRLGSLNDALPTDRFLVRWELTSTRVVAALAGGQRVDAPLATHLLSEVGVQEGVPYLHGTQLPDGSPLLGVQIPARFQEVKQRDPAAALAWRTGTRALFEAAFASDYSVVQITRDQQHPQDVAVYTLARVDL